MPSLEVLTVRAPKRDGGLGVMSLQPSQVGCLSPLSTDRAAVPLK